MTERAELSQHSWGAALSGDVTPAVAAHLDECAHCRRLVLALGRGAAFGAEAEPPPPADLARTVLERVGSRHQDSEAAHGSVGGRSLPGRLSYGSNRGRTADLPVVAARVVGTMMRRRLAALMVAAVAGLALAGVLASMPRGGAAPDYAQAGVASRPFTESCGTDRAHDDATRRRPLVVAGPWVGAEAAAFKKVLTRFSERTGVRVLYASQKREIAVTLEKRLSRGCPPDVALLPQPGLLRALARRGDLEPIDRSTQELMRRNLGSFWTEQGTVDDKLYGVWFKASNKSVLWYNRALFNAAGATEPGTWQQLLRAANMLQAGGTIPFSIAGGDGWTLTDWFENVYLQTAGAAAYEKLASHQIAWTDDSVRNALRRLAEIFRHPRWLAGSNSARLMETDFEKSVDEVFAARPRAAMVFEGDFVANHINRGRESDVGSFEFPSIDGAKRSIVVGGDVAALLTNNRDGQRLIRFLLSVQAARLWVASGGISPNRRVDLSAYANPRTRRFARAVVEAKATQFDLSDLQPPSFGSTPGQGMPRILKDYLSGDAQIDTVMRELEKGAEATFDCEGGVGVC